MNFIIIIYHENLYGNKKLFRPVSHLYILFPEDSYFFCEGPIKIPYGTSVKDFNNGMIDLELFLVVV